MPIHLFRTMNFILIFVWLFFRYRYRSTKTVKSIACVVSAQVKTVAPVFSWQHMKIVIIAANARSHSFSRRTKRNKYFYDGFSVWNLIQMKNYTRLFWWIKIQFKNKKWTKKTFHVWFAWINAFYLFQWFLASTNKVFMLVMHDAPQLQWFGEVCNWAKTFFWLELVHHLWNDAWTSKDYRLNKICRERTIMVEFDILWYTFFGLFQTNQ